MGNAQEKVAAILKSPRSTGELESYVGTMTGDSRQWYEMLLQGTIPTNFKFEDMCRHVHQLTCDNVILLPIWTLNLSNVESSAMCIINHWPVWSPGQIADENFLRGVRLLMPIFVPGEPIGHARFMFFDRWQPMPQSTLDDEVGQWSEVLTQFIDVPELAQLILVGYEGLCPSRHQHQVHSLKVIDSIPGSARVFQDDIQGFQCVVNTLMDPNWSPPERKQEQFQSRFDGVRAFLKIACASEQTDNDSDFTTEAIIFPSTPQRGLECIIITLCRVVATWLNPMTIPLENCTELCEDNKGRRILCELLLCEESGTQPSTADETPGQESPALVDATSNVDTVHPDMDDDVQTWYNVYSVVSFDVLSPTENYEPQYVMFDGRVGYEIYHGCRFVHHGRGQDFFPCKTVLALGGQGGHLRTTYICPIRNVTDKRWHFCLLGGPGFHLFRMDGKRDRSGKVPATLQFTDANQGPMSLRREETFSPREYRHLECLEFIDSLPDPTWKTELPSAAGAESIDDAATPAKKVGPRRPSRKPKIIKKRPSCLVTTPRRSKV